jgi:acetoin utilization deacetylase AcuC-like enzyme
MLKIYTNPASRLHDTGVGHPERPARLDAVLEGVARAGLQDHLIGAADLHPDADRIIAKVHSADYAQELERVVRAGSRFFHSLDNPISTGSFAAARGAVATGLAAARHIWGPTDGSESRNPRATRGFVVVRPPGHHAERKEAMGFCFFNTIACIAEWLLEQPGLDRIFIYDFDVHHGNGTQQLFEEREDVYYASIHRWPFYPGTGDSSEIGSGAGRGFTRNIPLDAGEGDAAFLRATEDQIVRIIDDYRPDAILLSAGFDAHRRDPLGGMNVTERAYGELTRRMVECAERWCDGRLLSLLEGGYDLEGLAASAAEHVTALNGEGRLVSYPSPK